MENNLELAILAGGHPAVVEHVILDNIIGDNDQHLDVPPFDLNEMDEMEVKQQFRFRRADIFRLKELLRIQDVIRIESRHVVQGKYLITSTNCMH